MLAKEQRELAENNYSLVYFFLNKHGIPIEEYHGAACVGLCKAAERFDAERGAFSTYAMWCIKNEVYHQMRTERKLVTAVSMDAEMTEDGFSLVDIIEDKMNTADCSTMMSCIMEEIDRLRPSERRAILMSMNGAKQRHIGAELGVSQVRVSRLLGSARRKLAAALAME